MRNFVPSHWRAFGRRLLYFVTGGVLATGALVAVITTGPVLVEAVTPVTTAKTYIISSTTTKQTGQGGVALKVWVDSVTAPSGNFDNLTINSALTFSGTLNPAQINVTTITASSATWTNMSASSATLYVATIDSLTVGSGGTFNANSNKLVNLATGTATGDAVNVGQVPFLNVSTSPTFVLVSAASATVAASTPAASAYSVVYKLSSATDKVYGQFSIPAQMTGTVITTSGFLYIYRDGVDVTPGGVAIALVDFTVSGQAQNTMLSGFFIDSPGNLVSHTYTMMFKSGNASDTFTLNPSGTAGAMLLADYRPNP